MQLSTFIGKLGKKYREAVAFASYRKGPGAYLNWLRVNYEMLRQATRVSTKPLNIYLEPTNVCQLKCPLCPTGLGLIDKPKGKLDPEMFRKLMEEIGDELFFIDFYNWGEPLAAKDRLIECVKLATAKGVISTVSSNLSLPLSEEDAEQLIASGLSRLIVSMDGASPETYSVYRKGGDFNLVVENIQKLVAAKKKLGNQTPLIYWQFLVFRFNEHELERAEELAEELGVDEIAFEPPSIELDVYPIPEPMASEIATWYPTDPKYNLYYSPDHPEQPKKRSTEKKVIGRIKRCDWLYMASAINWDGSVAPCCALYKNSDYIGNLGRLGEQSSYMETINNDAYRNTRDRFAGRITDNISELPCEYCSAEEITCFATPFNKAIPFYLLAGIPTRIIGGIAKLLR